MMDEIKFTVLVVLIIGIIMGVLYFSLRIMEIKYFQNVPTKCWVEGKLVYDGPSVAINVLSTGRTTRVDINGGFLYLFPKDYYVSDNVRLVANKKQGGKP